MPNFMQFMQMLQGGGNPMQILLNMVSQNPQMQNVLPLISNNGSLKNANELRNVYTNLCKQRGISPENFAQQMGVNLPR